MAVEQLPLAKRVREFRTDAKLTQFQLAERAGVRQATVSNIETGKTRRIDLETVVRIAKALRVEVADLFDVRKRSVKR
jgi:transcriptional regulator with XRE-family HTH domain